MKVYVVLEGDRWYGVSVEAVYLSKEMAYQLAEASSHYWVEEQEIADYVSE